MVWDNDPRGQSSDFAPEKHANTHRKGGGDYLPHFLSEDEEVGPPTLGDVIVGQASGTRVFWLPYGVVVPAGSALRNAFVLDNGDTVPTYKPTLDATAPTTIAEADAAAAGTSLIYSHRDHKHGAPATWKATAHNLLDGDRHGDTAAGTVARGDIVYGNSTPKWARLAKPSTASYLGHDGTDVAWDNGAWTTVAHNGSDFGADVGTFTVDAGDLSAFAYKLMGKTMHISFAIVNASQTTTAANYLTILIPAGKTANRTQSGQIKAMVAGTPLANTYLTSVASSTTLRIYVDLITATGGAGGTWGPVPLTNNIVLIGSITLETT